jgi:hypothetical protein
MPRIVSFLPSATEMVCVLGLEDLLVGVTHECDYPESVKSKPIVVRNVLPIETMSQARLIALSQNVSATARALSNRRKTPRFARARFDSHPKSLSGVRAIRQ